MLDLLYRSAPPSYKEFAPQPQSGGRVRACVCVVSRGRRGCGQTAMMGAPAPVAPRGWWSLFSATPQYKAAPAYQSQTCGDDDTPPDAQTATASASPEEAEEVICDDAGAQIHIW